MSAFTPQPGQRFTDAARGEAAARAAEREGADTSVRPEMFVVKLGEQAFTWELRRFGGMLLERGIEAFSTEALARADGDAVLASLCASPDPPPFERQTR